MNARIAVAVLLTVLQAIGVLIGIALIVAEIHHFGWIDYAEHFTYWSFTLQIAFYALTLPLPLIIALEYDGWPLRLQSAIIVLLFVPLWGIVTVVTVVVFVELAHGSTLLDGFARSESASHIVVNNVIFHFATQLWLLLYAIIYQRAIYWAYNWTFAKRAVHRSLALFWMLVLCLMLLIPGIALALYAGIFNFRRVYDTDTSFGVATAAVLVLLLIANSPLLFFIFLYHLGEAPLPAAWIRMSEFEALGERIVTTYERWRQRPRKE
jgi:hypothetical protein